MPTVDLYNDGSQWEELKDDAGNVYYVLVQESEARARERLLLAIEDPDSPVYSMTIDEALTVWRNGGV